MLDQLDALKEKLLKPISADAPCGEDPKYEDAYSALKEEIAKMSGMGAGATDWEKVENASFQLLENTAKELNLIVFLTTAWTVNHKLEGLIAGLECHTALIETHWQDMFPPLKRLKARTGALSWLQERLGEQIDHCKSKDRELISRALEAVAGLKDAVAERFEDPPCNLRKLRDTLEDWLRQIPETVAEPEEVPVEANPPEAKGEPESPKTEPASETPQSRPTSSAVALPPVAGDADADQLYEALNQIADQLLELDPAQPNAYLLRRMALWADVSTPNHNESKETFFPPPAEEKRNSLKKMFANGAWAELLDRLEKDWVNWWYWLDPQYYLSQAAANLGYEAIQQTVDREINRLLERLPDLAELKFNDGTAFASPETREWLTQLNKAAAGGAVGEEDPAAVLRGSMRKLGGDHFAEAMEQAQNTIAKAPNRRTAFRLRLEAAGFCMEAEQPLWMASLLRGVIQEAKDHRLDYWEPQLVARAWRLMLEVAHELKETKDEYLTWEQEAMHALATLDLKQAGLFPKKKNPYE